MAQFRQSGVDRFGIRSCDLHHGGGGSGEATSSSDHHHVSIGIRALHQAKPSRPRRSSLKNRRSSIAALALFFSLALLLCFSAFYYLSADDYDNPELSKDDPLDDESKNDLDFLGNVTRTERLKILKFGKGSMVHDGGDSRYWDRDDRRRDEDYSEDDSEHTSADAGEGLATSNNNIVRLKKNGERFSDNGSHTNSDNRGVGLYNEAGRNELIMYEAKYEASLKNVGNSSRVNENDNQLLDNVSVNLQREALDSDDYYDDGIDSHDAQLEDYDNIKHDYNEAESHNLNSTQSDNLDAKSKGLPISMNDQKAASDSSDEESSLKVNTNLRHFSSSEPIRSYIEKRPESKSKTKPKRRKYSGCEMKLLNSSSQLLEPLQSGKFARFSLQYAAVEEKPDQEEQWVPTFAGHQTLQQREESFLAQDKKINCGFVKGPTGSPSTGFDLAEDDARYISSCHIAVVSCIFGNSDRLRTPMGKTVSRYSRKNVCFVMFIDEITLQTLKMEGQISDSLGFIGVWKIVVVKNLPYSDMRRVGKVPKLLSHRLFPSARYSIWLDSKLRLQLDPLLILEYFLWRKVDEYAISNHYDRHCVWQEVAQNKKLNKYNHTIIDQQFAFYQADGLKKFNPLDRNRLLPSNVPEGSFIVREHTPMSNLFSCLWFNEVDRFTPRDQLSFAYTYQKLRKTNPSKPFHLNMFKDCERRAVTKLFRHRSEEKRNIPQLGEQ